MDYVHIGVSIRVEKPHATLNSHHYDCPKKPGIAGWSIMVYGLCSTNPHGLRVHPRVKFFFILKFLYIVIDYGPLIF